MVTRTLGAHLNMFENKLLVSSKGVKFWNLTLAKYLPLNTFCLVKQLREPGP